LDNEATDLAKKCEKNLLSQSSLHSCTTKLQLFPNFRTTTNQGQAAQQQQKPAKFQEADADVILKLLLNRVGTHSRSTTMLHFHL
jgi:hypothetical protein